MDAEEDDALAQAVKSLIALRGETFSKVHEETGVDRSNMSGWLRGVSQRLSKERKQKVLRYLGVEDGILRDDMPHEWAEGPPFQNLKTVLEYVAEEQGEPMLEAEASKGERTTGASADQNARFWRLRFGNTVVRFDEERGARGQPDLVQKVGDMVAWSEGKKGALDTRAMERLWEKATNDQEALQELLVYVTRQLLSQTSSSYQDAEGADWSTFVQMLAKAISEERPIGEVLGLIDDEEDPEQSREPD